jgi:hypothetical protein
MTLVCSKKPGFEKAWVEKGWFEKAWGEKANLITAESLELRQIPLCSFVSFVVKQLFWRPLAVLCRSLPLAREKLPWQDRFVVTIQRRETT